MELLVINFVPQYDPQANPQFAGHCHTRSFENGARVYALMNVKRNRRKVLDLGFTVKSGVRELWRAISVWTIPCKAVLKLNSSYGTHTGRCYKRAE